MGQRVDKRQVSVHVLILDQSAAHDDLGNQDQRHDIGRRFWISHERRNEEAKRHTGHGGHEHDAEIDPEHPANLQNVIADQDEEHTLEKGENAERNRFGNDVIRKPDIEVSLALEHGPVADDVVGAIRQAEKHRHDQTQK